MYIHIYIYIYIYVCLTLARELHLQPSSPSPPTKSFDVRGFDSSRLLILRGGNSHVHRIL